MSRGTSSRQGEQEQHQRHSFVRDELTKDRSTENKHRSPPPTSIHSNSALTLAEMMKGRPWHIRHSRCSSSLSLTASSTRDPIRMDGDLSNPSCLRTEYISIDSLAAWIRVNAEQPVSITAAGGATGPRKRITAHNKQGRGG